jgi:hypothetical protein
MISLLSRKQPDNRMMVIMPYKLPCNNFMDIYFPKLLK